MYNSGDTDHDQDQFQLFSSTVTRFENGEISLPIAIGLLCGKIYPQKPIYMRWRLWLSKENPLGFKQPTMLKLQQMEEIERKRTMIRLFHKRMIEALSKHSDDNDDGTPVRLKPTMSTRRTRLIEEETGAETTRQDTPFDAVVDDGKGYTYYMRKPGTKSGTFVGDNTVNKLNIPLMKGKLLPHHAAFQVKVASEGLVWDDETMLPQATFPDEEGNIQLPQEMYDVHQKLQQDSPTLPPKRESSRVFVDDDVALRALKRKNKQNESTYHVPKKMVKDKNTTSNYNSNSIRSSHSSSIDNDPIKVELSSQSSVLPYKTDIAKPSEIFENPCNIDQVQHNQRILERKYKELQEQRSYIQGLERSQNDAIQKVLDLQAQNNESFNSLTMPRLFESLEPAQQPPNLSPHSDSDLDFDPVPV